MDKNERNIVKKDPPPAFRVFVSSTWSDMLPYREAIQNALNKADCVPYGMERFGAQAIPPLEACYNELEKSQIYLCALGMRYGSIDEKTKKSFTQLEFEKARELGLPTLVFIIDEEKVSFKLADIEVGEGAEKLKQFKQSIKDSKEVTCAFFDSTMALQDAVYRSVMTEKKRQGQEKIETPSDDIYSYKEGAKRFRDFVRRPNRYKGVTLTLRVRMDGTFGGWRLRDENYTIFGMKHGDALYLNNLWVLGYDTIDVDNINWRVDCFAQDEAADWIDDVNVTRGTIFEGQFVTAYEKMPNATPRGNDEVDAWVAKLILVKGLRVIEQNVPSVADVGVDYNMLRNYLAHHLSTLDE